MRKTTLSEKYAAPVVCVMFVMFVFVVRERDLPVLLQSSDMARLFPWSDLNTIIERSHLYRTDRHGDCRYVQSSSQIGIETTTRNSLLSEYKYLYK